MALYNDIMRRDILSMTRDLLENRSLNLRDVDGKLEYSGTMAWDTPWHHVVHGEIADCHLWNTIIYQNIFKKLPQSVTQGKTFVPTGCQDCFKIVVRPQTLKSLFALVELQKRLGKACKCGLEVRDYVFGFYGGYFYTRGLEEGLERYKEVRKAVDADDLLGPHVKVILKRGCTEIEYSAGASNEWQVHPGQREMEELVYSKFNTDQILRTQPKHVVDYVHGRWIRQAYAWGDETVFEYLNPDLPIFPPYVTYHHLAEKKAAKKK